MSQQSTTLKGDYRMSPFKKFVFGNVPFIASTEPLLKTCNNLYREMSGQDSSGMSVKLCIVSSAYVESVFRRLIGNIAAILKIRNQYFQQ